MRCGTSECDQMTNDLLGSGRWNGGQAPLHGPGTQWRLNCILYPTASVFGPGSIG